jgi:hypothetical protein
MKNIIVALFLSVMTLAFASTARADDPTVVTPLDTGPFKVEKTDIIRLTAKGISGSKIDVKIVDGPAKVDATRNVSERKMGKHPIGVEIKEFDIKASDKGKVKVKITVTPPTGAKAVETNYEFEIQ